MFQAPGRSQRKALDGEHQAARRPVWPEQMTEGEKGEDEGREVWMGEEEGLVGLFNHFSLSALRSQWRTLTWGMMWSVFCFKNAILAALG